MVAWRQAESPTSLPEVLVRAFDRQGRPEGRIQRVDDAPGTGVHGPLGPRVAFIDGAPVVVWQVWRYGEVRRFARRLDSKGQPMASTSCIDAVPSALATARSEEIFGTGEGLELFRWRRRDDLSDDERVLERVRVPPG